MVSTKWTYHKDWSFANNYFIFVKILFQSENLFIKSRFDLPTIQMSIFILFVSAGVLFGAFYLGVSLKTFLVNAIYNISSLCICFVFLLKLMYILYICRFAMTVLMQYRGFIEIVSFYLIGYTLVSRQDLFLVLLGKT